MKEPIFPREWKQVHTESSRSADNDTLALNLLGKVNLVARGVLSQNFEIRDGIALLDESRRGVVEKSRLGPGGGDAGCEAASGEHAEDNLI